MRSAILCALTGRRNLFTASEFQRGLTDAPTNGDVTATTFSGLSMGTGLAFGTAGVTAYAYKDNFLPVAGQLYAISVFIRMDDGNAPAFGSATPSAATNDFALVIGTGASVPTSHVIENMGGGLYRVSSLHAAFAANTNCGVVKYNTNSARTFKVSGYQIERDRLTRYRRT
jgi:hypothetical protein